jgi:nucleotide-binding universal stress UspA family protein
MYKSILVPIDVTAPEICERILSRALFHLNHTHCKLTLLAVAATTSNENDLDEIRSQLMAFTEEHISEHQERVHLQVKTGLPAEQTLDMSESIQADCIMIGGHRGSNSMLGRPALGSTAAKVASQAKCDICIVKPLPS